MSENLVHWEHLPPALAPTPGWLDADGGRAGGRAGLGGKGSKGRGRGRGLKLHGCTAAWLGRLSGAAEQISLSSPSPRRCAG